MQCDICGKKKATVHLTEIVDEQMSEMHLCEECARTKSVQMEQQFGLSDLLAGLADFGKQVKDKEQTTLACANCKLDYEEFKKMGRLGCSECYTEFESHLANLLKKIHGSNRHLGKAPGSIPVAHKKEIETINDIKHEMQESIAREDFEKAAELRDKIRGMEQEDKS
ncbi:MAG: UvrB/UvrC motif-containing protein [Candidatus Omnitrophica bacterium]|nr:UvrB/UvrC motif-containing protein [Candidatus Omnitrophota bacterium]